MLDRILCNGQLAQLILSISGSSLYKKISSSVSVEWIKLLELFNFWWLALTGVDKSTSSSKFCWFWLSSLIWSLAIWGKALLDSITFLLLATWYWFPWNDRFLFSLYFNIRTIMSGIAKYLTKLPFFNFTDDVASLVFCKKPDYVTALLSEAFDFFFTF